MRGVGRGGQAGSSGRRRAAERAARGRQRGPGAALTGLLTAVMSPSQAGPAAGVSKTFAYQLDRKMGGVYRPPGTTYSDRYLDREERYEIARLRESGCSVREVARRTGRAASTISRELDRNADPRTGRYQPERAHRLAWERQRRPKPLQAGPRPGAAPAGTAAAGPAVLPGAGQREAEDGAPGRPGDAGQPREHLPVHLRVPPRRAAPRAQSLPAVPAGDPPAPRPPETRGTIIGAVPIGQRPPEVEGRLSPATTKET